MSHRDACRGWRPLLLGCLMIIGAVPAAAVQIWSGRSFTFVRPDSVDWTLPQYQDRITPAVWITRANIQGIFNIAQEAAYGIGSPLDTEWATGDAGSYQSLTFQPWVNWAGNNPPGTVGVDAVVHLISEDIYIDIRFDGWTARGGGGFAYTRAVNPVPVQDEAPTLVRLLDAAPNPFNPSTELRFDVQAEGRTRLELIDLDGGLVRILLDGVVPAGAGAVQWDGRDDAGRAVASGTYLVRLSAMGVTRVRTVTLVR